jgi:hypothetical protein
MDRRSDKGVSFVLVCLALWCAKPAAAQSEDRSLHVGGQLAGVVSSEFDDTDVGVGGQLSWKPIRLLGLDAEINFYPANFADTPAFSSSRIEGLFGATFGPRFGALRPFAKLRPGFVTFHEAAEPFACILIFPPPLRCSLASGRTMFALDIGGGIEWLPAGRAFVRVDAGDRMIRYPGPAFDDSRTVHDDDFFGHDFRFAFGGGVRF